MSCYKCRQPFDASRARPKLLPRCGHTVCALCLDDLLQGPGPTFKCPFDTLVYSKSQDFPDNLQFLEVALQKLPAEESMAVPHATLSGPTAPAQPALCRKHEKKLELFCHNCQETVCSDCALFAGHKLHEVEQLADTRLKIEQKIRVFRQKILEAKKGVECRALDLQASVEAIKRSKLAELDAGFQEMLDMLTQSRDRVRCSIAQFYDRLVNSLAVVKAKLEEVEAKVMSTHIEAELAVSPFKEKTYEKEIEDIEQTVNSRLMLSAKQQQELVTLSFDRQAIRAAKAYCKILFDRQILESGKKEAGAQDGIPPDEENLLQESFRDAIKQATDSLFLEKGVTVEESMRFKDRLQNSPSPNSYISELRNYSPMSGLSQKSGLSNVSRGERSMLKRAAQKPSGQLAADNCTQKKSLNNYETESQAAKRPDNPPQNVPRVSQVPDYMSIRSGASKLASKTMTQRFSEKENLSHNQDASVVISSRNLTVDQVKSLLETQFRANNDTIDLSNLGLTDKAFAYLPTYLKALKGFRTLKLNQNELTDFAFRELLKSIKDLGFQYLYLTRNQLKVDSLHYLNSFLKYNKCLKGVYLADNPGIVREHGDTRKLLAYIEQKGLLVSL